MEPRVHSTLYQCCRRVLPFGLVPTHKVASAYPESQVHASVVFGAQPNLPSPRSTLLLVRLSLSPSLSLSFSLSVAAVRCPWARPPLFPLQYLVPFPSTPRRLGRTVGLSPPFAWHHASYPPAIPPRARLLLGPCRYCAIHSPGCCRDDNPPGPSFTTWPADPAHPVNRTTTAVDLQPSFFLARYVGGAPLRVQPRTAQRDVTRGPPAPLCAVFSLSGFGCGNLRARDGSIPRDAVVVSFAAAFVLGSRTTALNDNVRTCVNFLGLGAPQRAADFMLAVKGNSYKGARYDEGDVVAARQPTNQATNRSPFSCLFFALPSLVMVARPPAGSAAVSGNPPYPVYSSVLGLAFSFLFCSWSFRP